MTITVARSDRQSPLPRDPERRVPVVMPRTATVGLLLITLDVTGLLTFGPAPRYGLILVLLTLSVMADVNQSRRRRGAEAGIPFVLLAGWLLTLWVGALVMSRWEDDTLVVIFTAMMLALGSLNMWFDGQPDSPAWSRWQAAPYVAGTLFALVAIVDASLGEHDSPVNLMSHERAFVAVYILSLPRRRRTWAMRGLVVVALLVSLYQYASATTALTLVLALGVGWIVRHARRALALAVGASVAAATLLVTGIAARILDAFYESSGRIDNTATREYLWAQGWDVVRESPVVGGATRVSITYLANIEGRITFVPLHNSYLTLLVVGGAVALVLLALGIVWMTVVGLAEPLELRRRIGTQWLPTFICAAVSMLVNPVLDRLGNAVFLVVVTLIGLAALTRHPSPGWTAEPTPESGP